MATTTPNFGWSVPTSSDLVKNGATAIETLGDSIDASLVDLKGGTTGQVLAKASGTDMDFSWVTDATGIPATIFDAKGDIIAASGADTADRLAVGANDLLLTAASGETTGLKYTGAWTSYTPTFTNITVGNGTLVAKYNQIGKIMSVRISFKLGSTSVVSNGGVIITLPGTGQPDLYTTTNIVYEDAGIGFYVGNAVVYGTDMYIGQIKTNATYAQHEGIGATTPFTWTTNDGIYLNLSYEVA
jgi:hypothetical protein